MAKAAVYTYGLGRRKRASARVRLSRGRGVYTINLIEKPWPLVIRRLFEALHLDPGSFDLSVKVVGGGITAQLEAIRMGVGRAILVGDASLKPTLRKLGVLTRDPREKERKKPGLKRARRAPQFAKR